MFRFDAILSAIWEALVRVLRFLEKSAESFLLKLESFSNFLIKFDAKVLLV